MVLVVLKRFFFITSSLLFVSLQQQHHPLFAWCFSVQPILRPATNSRKTSSNIVLGSSSIDKDSDVKAGNTASTALRDDMIVDQMDRSYNDMLAEQLIDKARGLVPILKDRSQEAEDNGCIHDETIAAIVDAGLLRVLQSKDYGGYELDPEIFYTIQAILAEGDMSVAWNYGVLGVHPWQIALFDKACQDEIYGENGSKADTIVASTYMPTGQAQRTGGGVRLSGRWGFSSGIKCSEWVILGGMIIPEKEEQGGAPAGMAMGNFLVHKDDIKIIDNWDVVGLKATGSHDVVVDDVFIPDHRIFHFGIPAGGYPGNQINDAPLFRIDFGQIFPRAVAYAAVGALQAVCNEVRNEFATAVSPNTGVARGDLPEVQAAYSNAINEIEQQTLIMKATSQEWMDYASRRTEFPLERRSYRRYQGAQVVDKCLDAATELYKHLGGNVVRRGVVSKAVTDLAATRCHVANMSFKQSMNYGSVANGRPQLEYFL